MDIESTLDKKEELCKLFEECLYEIHQKDQGVYRQLCTDTYTVFRPRNSLDPAIHNIHRHDHSCTLTTPFRIQNIAACVLSTQSIFCKKIKVNITI